MFLGSFLSIVTAADLSSVIWDPLCKCFRQLPHCHHYSRPCAYRVGLHMRPTWTVFGVASTLSSPDQTPRGPSGIVWVPTLVDVITNGQLPHLPLLYSLRERSWAASVPWFFSISSMGPTYPNVVGQLPQPM